jgi:uncharacterized membrane protein YkoI
MMRNTTKLAIATAVVAVAAGGGAYAWAGAGDDGDENYTGPGANQARQAAIAHLGGGTANAVERDDEDAAWEVEVTKDGNTVDVHLDANYNVVGTEGDNETENESGDEE